MDSPLNDLEYMYNFTHPCPWNPCLQKATTEFGIEGLIFITIPVKGKFFTFIINLFVEM